MAARKTNVLLDEELVDAAKELTGVRFTKDVLDLALRRLVRNLRRRRLLRLAGKVNWEGDLSAMRLTGARTKREAVDIALRRLVEKGTLYRAVLRLRGKLAWDGDVDAWRSARALHQLSPNFRKFPGSECPAGVGIAAQGRS